MYYAFHIKSPGRPSSAFSELQINRIYYSEDVGSHALFLKQNTNIDVAMNVPPELQTDQIILSVGIYSLVGNKGIYL